MATNKKTREKRRKWGRELAALTATRGCPACSLPGQHFMPPALGERGFYTCERIASR